MNTVFRGGEAAAFAEKPREMLLGTESGLPGDFVDPIAGMGELRLGVTHLQGHLVASRGLAEAFLEAAAEVVGGTVREASQIFEAERIAKTSVDLCFDGE